MTGETAIIIVLIIAAPLILRALTGRWR